MTASPAEPEAPRAPSEKPTGLPIRVPVNIGTSPRGVAYAAFVLQTVAARMRNVVACEFRTVPGAGGIVGCSVECVPTESFGEKEMRQASADVTRALMVLGFVPVPRSPLAAVPPSGDAPAAEEECPTSPPPNPQ